MEPSCCRTPKILWDSAWTWRCLACNTAGAHETAIIGDPWGRARRPQVSTVRLHAGEDYSRGYQAGRAAVAWEIMRGLHTP